MNNSSEVFSGHAVDLLERLHSADPSIQQHAESQIAVAGPSMVNVMIQQSTRVTDFAMRNALSILAFFLSFLCVARLLMSSHFAMNSITFRTDDKEIFSFMALLFGAIGGILRVECKSIDSLRQREELTRERAKAWLSDIEDVKYLEVILDSFCNGYLMDVNYENSPRMLLSKPMLKLLQSTSGSEFMQFDYTEKSRIRSLFDSNNTYQFGKIMLEAIRIVEEAKDVESISHLKTLVEAVVPTEDTVAVKQRARDALKILEDASELLAMKGTLLRPSAGNVDNDKLLRPAPGGKNTDPEILLHTIEVNPKQ